MPVEQVTQSGRAGFLRSDHEETWPVLELHHVAQAASSKDNSKVAQYRGCDQCYDRRVVIDSIGKSFQRRPDPTCAERVANIRAENAEVAVLSPRIDSLCKSLLTGRACMALTRAFGER